MRSGSVAMIFDARLDRRRLGAVGVLASSSVVLGTLVLISIARRSRGYHPAAHRAVWVVVSVVVVAVFLVCRVIARNEGITHRATVLAVGAGTLFAFDAAFLKVASNGLGQPALMRVALSFAGFLITATFGNVLIQQAFHIAPLGSSLPTLAASEPVLGLALGVILFHERLGTQPAAVAAGLAGVALLAGGAASAARTAVRIEQSPTTTNSGQRDQ
jgi:hypothetical protein